MPNPSEEQSASDLAQESALSSQLSQLNQSLAEKDRQIAQLKTALNQQTSESKTAQKVQNALLNISELASGAEEISEFYRSIHKAMSELIYAENFYIGLINRERGVLTLVYFVDSVDNEIPNERGEFEIPLDSRSVSIYTIEQRKTLLLDKQAIKDLENANKIMRIGPIAKSWLGSPLFSDNEVIGIIVVQSYDESNLFEPWQTSLFEYISNAIATTLERKKHHLQLENIVALRTQELKKEVDKRAYQQKTENALLRLSELANSTIALSEFYRELHRIIGEFIYAENFYIAIKDSKSKTVSFVYFVDTIDTDTLEDLQQLPAAEIEKSITGYLFRYAKPLLTNNEEIAKLGDAGEIERYGPDTISWLGIPLILDGDVFGVMTLQSYKEEFVFTEKDKRLMEYMSKPVATAIERKTSQFALESLVNSRTEALNLANLNLKQEIEEKSRAEKLSNTLYEIASLASGAEKMQAFYEGILSSLSQLFPVENLSIALVNTTNDSLELAFTTDPKANINQVQLLTNNTLSNKVVKTGKPILIGGGELDRKKCSEKKLDKFVSWLGAPLHQKGKVKGIIVVKSYDPKLVFEEWHLSLLTYVSEQIMIALSRKQARTNLEETVKERTLELEKEIEVRKRTESTQSALYQIANLAIMDMPLSEFYHALQKVIGTLIYCENFYIALKDTDSASIKMVHYVDTMDDYDIESIASLPISKVDKSLTGYALNAGEPLLLDYKQAKTLAAEKKIELMGADTVSWLGIPLKIEDNVIGIMTLQSYKEAQVFTDADKELMVFVGQHIATALQRKRSKDYLKILVERRTDALNQSNHQLKQQIEETEHAKKLQTALYQITDLASTAVIIDDLYASIHHIISQLIYAENFYICLYDEDKVNLDFVYFVDTEDDLTQEKLQKMPADRVKETATGSVLTSGASILRTPENREKVLSQSARYIGKKSLFWLGVPLKIDSNILGVIAIQSYKEEHKIGEAEKELLEFVSHHIALTLERKNNQSALERRVIERTAKLRETNLSLEQQVQERKRSEATQATLYYIANLANKDLPIETTFEKIHRAIGKLVYAENFYIALWNRETDELEWPYFVDSDQDYDYGFVKQLPVEQRRKTLARKVVMSASSLMISRKEIEALDHSGEISLIGPASEYYLGVPLIGSDGPIGVMAVQSYDRQIRFSDSDLELVNFVAQSIVSIIERRSYNTKLEERVNRRTQELTVSNERLQIEIFQRKESEKLQNALFKISETPQACATEQELYARLHDIISRMMYAKSFYIALVDEKEGTFIFDYVKDEVDTDIPHVMPIGNSLTSYVYRQKKTVHVNREHIAKLEEQGEVSHLGSYAKDWVGVPLLSGDDILGIMILQSYDENYLYGEREIGILNFVSTHIAEALLRKRAERELRVANQELAVKTQKAEEANRAKSSFLATVSHEIRTPMNGILGLLSLMQDTEMTSQQRDYVNKVAKSSQSLLEIINDILDFSKIEQAKLELENRPFNLIDVIDNLVDVFAGRIAEKGLDFTVDLTPDVRLYRVGDALRLSQILINLVGNAVKFTEKGFIRIFISEPKENELTFSVNDSGIGISPEKRKHIFSSFTQADDTTTRRFGGSGLGLSISQQLVHLMGGQISVKGELNEGSQFQFQIHSPKVESTNKNQQEIRIYDRFKRDVLVQNDKSVNIVLVSKNGALADAWEHLSKRFGYHFTFVQWSKSNAQALINQLSENSFSDTTHMFFDLSVEHKKDLVAIEAFAVSRCQSQSTFLLAGKMAESELSGAQIEQLKVVRMPLRIEALLNLLCYHLEEVSELVSSNSENQKASFTLVGKSILLAEDNKINQQVAYEFLKKAGANVEIAENGKDAVSLCKTRRYDLVLMDMQMPVMDGYTATLKIREHFAYNQLPIIAMTANMMKGDREKCLQYGMNDYIGKPIDRQKMFSMIESHISDTTNARKTSHSIEIINKEDGEKVENKSESVESKGTLSYLEILTKKFESSDLVNELILLFVENHTTEESTFRELFVREDIEAMQKLIHKLKGSLGEMELHELFAEAQRLDAQLKAGKMPLNIDVDNFFLKLIQKLEELSALSGR